MARLFFLIMFTSAALVSCSQQYDPLQLTKKIFSKEAFPNIKNYCIGEYSGHPNGDDLEPNTKVNIDLLSQNNENAVVHVEYRALQVT